MRILLDTHVLLWWVSSDPRLPPTVLHRLSAPDTTILISAVSAHEITTKHRLGKLTVPQELAHNLESIVTSSGWQALPLSIVHAQLAGSLPGHHRDPFDWMLAAQALSEDVPIASADAAMIGFGVNVIW
ncbi:MAG: type II toxin-antitoxin system VapC family toxin [Hyphomicrobiaceae bacterium]|nr:type II toxin-antitoxin system VapC family toxin [Hyphomicrobiaceae bacterium]